MNFKQMNEVLAQNNLSFDKIKELAKKYENLDLKNEDHLRDTINDLSILLGKKLSVEQQNKMIDTIKKGEYKW